MKRRGVLLQSLHERTILWVISSLAPISCLPCSRCGREAGSEHVPAGARSWRQWLGEAPRSNPGIAISAGLLVGSILAFCIGYYIDKEEHRTRELWNRFQYDMP